MKIKQIMFSLILIVGSLILLTGCQDKSNPIIFQKESNEEYAYIIYEGKEYVPYCAIFNNDRGEYLGHIKDDEQEEIYTYKSYSKDEWFISFNKIGLGGESMLFKEKNVTNIPDGLSSEYNWNN